MIEMENVSKWYGPVQVLNNCSLRVDKGEEVMDRGSVYDIPNEQDQELAALKLATMGMSIDKLTEEQMAYNLDYAAGT